MRNFREKLKKIERNKAREHAVFLSSRKRYIFEQLDFLTVRPPARHGQHNGKNFLTTFRCGDFFTKKLFKKLYTRTTHSPPTCNVLIIMYADAYLFFIFCFIVYFIIIFAHPGARVRCILYVYK